MAEVLPSFSVSVLSQCLISGLESLPVTFYPFPPVPLLIPRLPCDGGFRENPFVIFCHLNFTELARAAARPLGSLGMTSRARV